MNIAHRLPTERRIAALGLLCGSLTWAQAATYTWTGAGGSDWTNPASWNPGTGVPGPDDTAIVAVAGVTVTGSVSVGTLQLNGVTLAGAGTLTVLDRLEWTGTSSMLGGGTTVVGPEAVLMISGSGDRALDGRVLINEGRIEHAPGSRLLFYNSSRVENREEGVIELQGDITWAHAGGNVSTLVNTGRFVKSAGDGTVVLPDVRIENPGTFSVGSGTLHFPSGMTASGEFEAAEGTTVRFTSGATFDGVSFMGPGIQRLESGTFLLNGAIRGDNLELTGGVWTGTNEFTGRLTWLGSNIQSPVETTLLPGSVLRVEGTGDRGLNGARLINRGRIEHVPGSRLLFYNSSRVENPEEGVIELQGDITWAHAGGNVSTVANTGLWVKSAGEGTAVANTVTFENSGTLGCHQGILRFDRPPSLLPGSILRFRLSAPVHPVGHGRITCDQAMPIGGALVVEYAGGFVPGPGEVYRIVSAPSVSGTFGTYTAPPLAPGVFINPRYLANAVELFTTDPTPTVLGGAGMNAEGLYGLTIQGIVNQSYAVDASTDLEEWTTLATSAIPASTLWQFVDPESDLFPYRFYRVRFLPLE